MHSILLITPDFLIILMGAFITWKLGYPKQFWQWTKTGLLYPVSAVVVHLNCYI